MIISFLFNYILFLYLYICKDTVYKIPYLETKKKKKKNKHEGKEGKTIEVYVSI